MILDSFRGNSSLQILIVLSLTSSGVLAQTEKLTRVQNSPTTITAAVSGDGVRIAAPQSVVQMHLEVYAAGGEKLFDNEVRANVFDWHLQNSQAERVAPGDYLCVVTIKNIAGGTTQKIGAVTVGDKEVRVELATSTQLSFVQAQAGGWVENGSSWTILDTKENETTTVIAHDGTDGQMIRGRGALTFRIGDFFSGNDKEQMRLTEAGNLGIGTAKPKFKLDVAGSIRARQGFVFRNGSTLNVNDQGALTLTSSSGSVTPSVAGTGTQGQVAKWTDNSGTLGNSVLTEAASTTLSTTLGPMVGVNATLNNTGLGNSALQVRGVTLNGQGDLATGLDVAPTFAPSANISSASGFVSAAYAAPPPGVTITDQFGGNSTIVYTNVSGAVTNGTSFNIAAPVILGSLKPTTQTGLRIRNQGIGGTANSYGLFVDA
jgi:hypothetical protein